jgi:HTH-type transcriptional regulator/antitoxin HigA
MQIQEIKTKKDYAKALKRLKQLWGAKNGTSEGDELNILAFLIDKHEAQNFPIEPPKK